MKYLSATAKNSQVYTSAADMSYVIYNVLSIIALFVSLFIFLLIRVQFDSTEQKVRELLLQKRALQEQILPLQLEERALTEYSKVLKVATEQLHLRESTLQQKLLIPVVPHRKE